MRRIVFFFSVCYYGTVRICGRDGYLRNASVHWGSGTRNERMCRMQYISHYQSPVGGILLAADEAGLTGLWFEGAKYFADQLEPAHEEKDTPALEAAKRWLALYFSGTEPDFLPPIHLKGSPFRLAVWEILQKIPYGKTLTYGEIAKEIARLKGLPQNLRGLAYHSLSDSCWDSLSQSGGNGWKPDRIRGRGRQESKAPGAGKGGGGTRAEEQGGRFK